MPAILISLEKLQEHPHTPIRRDFLPTGADSADAQSLVSHVVAGVVRMDVEKPAQK